MTMTTHQREVTDAYLLALVNAMWEAMMEILKDEDKTKLIENAVNRLDCSLEAVKNTMGPHGQAIIDASRDAAVARLREGLV